MSIVKSIKPSFYDEFACSGPQCKNSCCQVWGIMLSKKEYTGIKNQIRDQKLCTLFKSAFPRVKKGATASNYAFVSYDDKKKCRLLNEDGLCRLQLACGHQSLPRTCKVFPRALRYFGSAIDLQLSLGCEEAVKLLLQQKDGICFVSSEVQTNPIVPIIENLTPRLKKWPSGEYFWDIKTLFASVLQKREFSMDDRMILLGLAMKELNRLDQEETADQLPGFVDDFIESMDEELVKPFESIHVNQTLQLFNAQLMFDIVLNMDASMNYLLDRVHENLGIKKKGKKEVIDIEHLDNREMKYNIAVDEEAFAHAQESYRKLISTKEYVVENIMLSWISLLQVPFWKEEKTIWDGFLLTANLYNMLKYILMGCITEDSSEEDLVDVIVRCSRMLTHSEKRLEMIVDRMKETETTTLAHMAMLIKS